MAYGVLEIDKAFNIEKIRNMMDINVDLLQWSIYFLIKIILVVALKMRIFQTKNLLKNFKKQLL